ALIQSDTATAGPGAPESTVETYGSRDGSPGFSMFHASQASASRRSSVQEVADHTSADTPQSAESISWAVRAWRSATPEARIWARGEETPDRSASPDVWAGQPGAVGSPVAVSVPPAAAEYR